MEHKLCCFLKISLTLTEGAVCHINVPYTQSLVDEIISTSGCQFQIYFIGCTRQMALSRFVVVKSCQNDNSVRTHPSLFCWIKRFYFYSMVYFCEMLSFLRELCTM